MKTLTVKYVTKTKTGSFEYRRQVPAALRKALGRYEFKKVLGITEKAAIRAYPGYHDFVERQMAEAKQPTPTTATPETVRTAMEDWKEAVSRLKAYGIDPTEPVFSEPGEFTEADALAEAWTVKDRADSLAYGMLTGSGNAKPPEATFEDAKRLYVKTRVEGGHDEKRKRLRMDVVTKHIKNALGKDPKLSELTRSDAREVVAEILSTGVSPNTVDRYCNDIRAAITFGIREFELERVAINPFVKIDIKGLKDETKTDRDERHPFSPKQLKDTRAFVLGHAGIELQRIWRILEGAGLRLGEASGLQLQDVVIDGEYPHLDIRFNDIRRLKNKASIRPVPLMGDTLAAVKEALAAVTPTDGTKVDPKAPLFPSYGRPRGADAASAALMKNIRHVVSDPKVTVHSLRHTMQDRMLRAGVSEYDRHIILGHSVAGEAQRYESYEARLVAASKAMALVYPQPR